MMTFSPSSSSSSQFDAMWLLILVLCAKDGGREREREDALEKYCRPEVDKHFTTQAKDAAVDVYARKYL